MTNPRGVHSTHLDAATIAAFVDRTLDPAVRAAAEAHLAACADCREVWVETSEMAGEAEAEAGGANAPTASPRARSRRWIYGGAGLAAAVVLSAVLWFPASNSTEIDTAIAELAEAATPSRFTLGRTSGPFVWAPPPSSERGANRTEPSLALQQAALRLRQLDDQRRSGATLRGAALAYMALGEPARAVDALERAASMDPANAVDLDLAAALLEQWRTDESAAAAARALHHAEVAFLRDKRDAAAAFNRALALEAVGLRTRAAGAWRDYLKLDAASPWRREAEDRLARLEAETPSARAPAAPLAPADPSLRACLERFSSATRLWREAYDAADHVAALQHAHEAGSTAACAGVPAAQTFVQIGLAEVNLGIRTGEKRLARGLAAARQQGQWEFAARAALSLGIQAFRDSDIERGFQLLAGALDDAKRSGHSAIQAITHSMLADAFQEQGEIELTWNHVVDSVHHLDDEPNYRWRYTVLSGAAINARAARWDGAALLFAQELFETTRNWTNTGGRILAALEIAQAKSALGLRPSDAAELREARTLTDRLDEPIRSEFRAEILAAEGRLLSKADPAKAIVAFDESLRLFESTGNLVRRAGVLLDRGRAHREAADLPKARGDWRAAIALADEEGRTIGDRTLRVSRFAHLWDMHDELLRSHVDDPSEALLAFERSRGREFAADVSAGSAEDIGVLQDWLPAGTIALVYAVLPEQMLRWQVSQTDITLSRVPVSSAQLGRFVDDHVDAVRRGREPGGHLADSLLPEEMPGTLSALIVVPDGPLHRLPFATLQRTTARGPLLRNATVVVAPGLRAARALAARCAPHVAGKALLAGFGGASARYSLPALPSVDAEIRAVSRNYHNPNVLQGTAASRDAVIAAIGDASVIHLSAHAMADLASPQRSRLLLAPSALNAGELTAHDVRELDLTHRPLVILPACETAIGRVYRGEGTFSLVAPFLSAGASGVVGTLWPIRDGDAEKLMSTFHRELQSGLTPAHALGAAQRAAEARGLPSSSWAAFVYYGSVFERSRCRL